ncbi:MAG: YgcG family protein [Burkholderiales bacterium]|nr:YgcG family protein [Burkholderiales bacterium]
MSILFTRHLAHLMRHGIHLFCTALLCVVFSGAYAEIAIPPLKARVTDLTGTLSQIEMVQLEQQLAGFEAEKGSQIVVLIIPTTQPETIEQYSIRVAGAWQPGRKGIDDGVLLLIAKNDKALRIETGYGLEGVLPDALARRIIDEIIVPQFRQGRFYVGLQAGIERIISIIEGEPLPEPAASNAAGTGLILENFLPFLFIALVLGRMLQNLFGRMAGATIMGVIAAILAWLISASLAVALLVAVAIFVISLFERTSRIVHRGGYRSDYRNWPGSDSIGGGLGGGFRGGGGGFGGGGASGKW